MTAHHLEVNDRWQNINLLKEVILYLLLKGNLITFYSSLLKPPIRESPSEVFSNCLICPIVLPKVSGFASRRLPKEHRVVSQLNSWFDVVFLSLITSCLQRVVLCLFYLCVNIYRTSNIENTSIALDNSVSSSWENGDTNSPNLFQIHKTKGAWTWTAISSSRYSERHNLLDESGFPSSIAHHNPLVQLSYHFYSSMW